MAQNTYARTNLERAADQMDRQLFALMTNARYMSEATKAVQSVSADLAEAAALLAQARPLLRRHMHQDDQATTGG